VGGRGWKSRVSGEGKVVYNLLKSLNSMRRVWGIATVFPVDLPALTQGLRTPAPQHFGTFLVVSSLSPFSTLSHSCFL
jgi:hypothetical protein